VTADALLGLKVTKTIVVGGSGVIADSVLADLPEPTRVNGVNRFATSVALAEYFEVEADHFYLATGHSFADAISGSVLAAKEGTGLLLVDKTLPQSVADFIVAQKVRSVTALGGTGSVSDAVLAAISELLAKISGYTLSIAGPDTVSINQPTEFAVTLKGDGAGLADVFGTLKYSVEGGKGTLEYKDGDEWKQLPLAGHFGPEGGFTITPDWDQTTQLRFTAEEMAAYTATVSLEVEGNVVATESLTLQTAAGVVPEEFAVARTEAINYYGYSVGFQLTEGLSPADVAAIEVTLFNGETVLAVNTAKEALFGLEDIKHTSPFNVYGDFENYTEEYWNLGKWNGELLEVPNKAVITVTLVDGREITVQNTNLTGDTSTIIPKVWNVEQEKAYSTVQAAINAAEAGETIFLTAGTHTGHLSINKSINLIGVDQEEVILDASAYNAYGIYVKADDVSFSNFTFLAPTQETSHTYGFKVEDSNKVSISNVTVKDSNRTAVDLNNVTEAAIDNVSVEGTVRGVGIALTNCADVTVTNSTFTDNAWGDIAVFTTGEEIVIGVGNSFGTIYTQGTEFNLDLADSGVEYKLTDSARPAFTFYFAEAELAEAAAVVATTNALSNLDGTEYYVLEGMSIQAAVDVTEEGSVIYLDGKFQEDIIIDTDDLTLLGNEKQSVEIEGSVIVNASNVTIAGFTFTSFKPGAIIQVTGASDNTTIVGNIFLSDNTAMGILLDTGTPTNVTIEGNVFRFLHSGVYIHRGENVSIEYNDFTDIVEGAVSIETWAKDVTVDYNFVYFTNALVFFWSDYYSEELVFDDEVIVGEGNVSKFVNYLVYEMTSEER